METASAIRCSINHKKSFDELCSSDTKQEETPEIANLKIDDQNENVKKDEMKIDDQAMENKSNDNINSVEDSDNDSDDDDDEEESSSEDEMFEGLTKEQKEAMKQKMAQIQNKYQDHLEEDRVRKIKEIQEQFGFNLAVSITEEEAQFVAEICKENQLNLTEQLQDQGSFFLESIRDMMRQREAMTNEPNNYSDPDDDDDDEDDDDDDDEEWVVEQKKKKETRKKKRAAMGLKKNTNLDGSERCGRLLLNDAMENIEKMEGWSEARKNAWKNRETKPNAYFYRFNVPGQPQKNGKWSRGEHKLFMKQAKARGVNDQWGIFSKKIPGRVGYQCSNYWRGLVKDALVKDPNYKITINGTSKKLHFRRNIPNFTITPNFKKFSFTIVKDKSGVWPQLPCTHPSRPSDEYMEKVKAKFASIPVGGSKGNDSNKNKKKSNRKRKRKNNDDSDEDFMPSTKRRRRNKNNDGDETFNCSVKISTNNNQQDDNPMADFIDIMTGAPIIKPAISPYGHVLGYDTWTKILRTSKNKNLCPFTLQKMTRRSLIKLTKNNYEEYKGKIQNITEEQTKLLALTS